MVQQGMHYQGLGFTDSGGMGLPNPAYGLPGCNDTTASLDPIRTESACSVPSDTGNKSAHSAVFGGRSCSDTILFSQEALDKWRKSETLKPTVHVLTSGERSNEGNFAS